MKKFVCEQIGCQNEATGEYQRRGFERIGWHKNMSIHLCSSHRTKRHIKAKTRMFIIDGELIIKMTSTNSSALRKNINKKPVVMLTMQNEQVNKFKSANEAAKKTGIKNQTIYLVLSGKRKSTGGYIFKYAS